MRKRQTFLLTILTEETETTSFCGRIKVIASGKCANFTNMEELYGLLVSEMSEDALIRHGFHEHSSDESKKLPS